ncbi:MAG: abortive infection family protein [Bacteroidota bacterium]
MAYEIQGLTGDYDYLFNFQVIEQGITRWMGIYNLEKYLTYNGANFEYEELTIRKKGVDHSQEYSNGQYEEFSKAYSNYFSKGLIGLVKIKVIKKNHNLKFPFEIKIFALPDEKYKTLIKPYAPKEDKNLDRLREVIEFFGQRTNQTADVKVLTKLTDGFIREQIDKCRKKLDEKDFDGAITNARSLCERTLEYIITKSGKEIPDYKGSLPRLFKESKKYIGLEKEEIGLSDPLKQLLSGSFNYIQGISSISSSSGDRHSQKYEPEPHYAKLVVNSAFTFCEFIIEHLDYLKR